MTTSQRQTFDFVRNTPRYFWLLSVIFMITFGVLFLDHFRTYSSQVTILVVHKNEKTAGSADQVVYTIAEIPKTLAFYDRLLKQFPEVKDPWIGMSSDQRKALWQERVSSKRVNNSGLIHLRISADTASDATLLAQKSATNLFQMVGRYYNIRTELDIRTIDPPISSVEISNPLGYLLAVFSVGFLVAALVSSGISLVSMSIGRIRLRKMFIMQKEQPQMPLVPVTFDEIPQEHNSFRQGDTYPLPTLEKSVTSALNLPFLEEGMSLEEHLFGTQNTVNTSDSMENANVVASPAFESPGNLPVRDVEQKLINVTPLGEPTAEELKRRLNQLLKGEM